MRQQCEGKDMSGRCPSVAVDDIYCKRHRREAGPIPKQPVPPVKPFSPKSSLSHTKGGEKKARAEAMLEASTRGAFLLEIRGLAVEFIQQNGSVHGDDLHIWCEENGVPIPLNKDDEKTIMTQVFKDLKIFQPVLDGSGKPLKRPSKLITNNKRVTGVYELNPEWDGTFR